MKKFLIIFSCAILFLTSVNLSFAASGTFEVDTGGEVVNAVEGIIRIPPELKIEDIQTGSSAILIWIKSPVFDAASNTISFAGITPGGFAGRYAVFSFSGEFEMESLPRIEIVELSAAKNDGSGSVVEVEGVVVSKSDSSPDSTPPEMFGVIISSSPDLFDGQKFVSFHSQDKSSGIERYEYTTTWLLRPKDGSWQEAVSPLVLSKIELFKRIHIKAVDESGNYRVVSIFGPYYYLILMIGIIIAITGAILGGRKVFRRSQDEVIDTHPEG